jgi:L-ascorbate metabolism protein UlaG (beta-lactamase superfamily)
MKSDSVIIANPRAALLIGERSQIMRPWQGAFNVAGVSIRGVPAYTINQAFHARSFDGLGFVISIMHHDIYYAGDTDMIAEMDKIGCDIAILPVGGVFTMNFNQAADAARAVKASYAIPMHYGREVSGSTEDGKHFCQTVNSGIVAVELPMENPNFTI